MNTRLSLSLLLTFVLFGCSKIGNNPDILWPKNLETQVGETYEIRWSKSTETVRDNGSKGSSQNRYILLESVLEVSPTELVLEYDMPAGTSDIDRRRAWQFPARVRLTPDNKMTLLNPDDLRDRNSAWLAWANYSQSDCGQWLFTWVAQVIECDPNSVIDVLKTYNIRRTNLEVGALYASPIGREPVALFRDPFDGDLKMLVATLELDTENVRQERAKFNLILAQMTGEEGPTLEEELQTLQKEKISGTLKVIYALDSRGDVIRRVQVTQMNIVDVDGITEASKSTEIVERKRLNENGI